MYISQNSTFCMKLITSAKIRSPDKVFFDDINNFEIFSALLTTKCMLGPFHRLVLDL